MRVIDEAGGNLGIFPRDQAIELARQKGLDLIEIAPGAKPPVARIMSFDKFRYQKEKELKKQRVAEKAATMKQIQVSARSATHDLQVKATRANAFLEKGSKVEIFMVLRGREKGNRPWAEQKLKEFMTLLDPSHKVVMAPRYTGRGFIVHVVKPAK